MDTRLSSKQRLLRAIHCQEADRVPVSPRLYIWVRDTYGCSCWLHLLQVAAEFDFDPFIYLNSPYPNYIGELRAAGEELGPVRIELEIEREAVFTRIRRTIHTPAGKLSDRFIQPKPHTGYGSDPNPNWEERLVKSPADLDALAYLLPKPEPAAYADIVATQAAVGERGLVNLYINSPLDHQAGWAYELIDLMVACHEDPAFVRRILRLFQDHTLAEMQAALQAGVEMIFVPWYFASLSSGWSPRFYQEFFLPLLKEQVALVHSYGGIYHYYDDGKVSRILPWLIEAGIDVLSTVPPPPIGDVDLAQAKALAAGRVCLNGNIDLIHVIKDGTPTQIHAAVRQAILEAAPGGGFILGTSDSIRDAPRENVQAYFQAARLYGDYAHLGRA